MSHSHIGMVKRGEGQSPLPNHKSLTLFNAQQVGYQSRENIRNNQKVCDTLVRPPSPQNNNRKVENEKAHLITMKEENLLYRISYGKIRAYVQLFQVGEWVEVSKQDRSPGTV